MPDRSEMIAGTKGILSIQHYYNVSCEVVAEGFGDTANRMTMEQILEFGKIAIRNNYLKQGVDGISLP